MNNLGEIVLEKVHDIVTLYNSKDYELDNTIIDAKFVYIYMHNKALDNSPGHYIRFRIDKDTGVINHIDQLNTDELKNIFNIEKELIIMEKLKVASTSNPSSVAGALANVIYNDGKVEVQAIGAGAVNQTVKAIAIARGFVAPQGIDLICIPAFADALVEGEEKTAMNFIVTRR